jgi:hypothetical protein
LVTVAAVDGFGVEFGFGPNMGRVVGSFVVALDTGIKFTAALVLNGNNVALRMPVGALGALVHVGAVNGNGFKFHSL